MAQTPQTDQHWIKNNTFSDEFNGSKTNIWYEMSGGPLWGSQFCRPQNILFGTEGSRSFLRFKAEMENGTPYSGGIWTGYNVYSGYGHNGLGYGYYEIEARVIQTPGIVSGLWPAFWMQHENFTPPYWYEELDIFEPNNCQVQNNNHHVTYWRIDDETKPFNTQTNSQPYTGDRYNVDMSVWHKYAVEWLPEKVVFYIDDESCFTLDKSIPYPYHQNPCLRIDLQTDKYNQPPGWYCPPDILDGLLGYFDINYFRYYQLLCSSEIITEAQGNGYNFNNYTYKVKKSCIFKNASVPNNTDISIRATDFIELKENFEVPLGATLYLDITPCALVKTTRD